MQVHAQLRATTTLLIHRQMAAHLCSAVSLSLIFRRRMAPCWVNTVRRTIKRGTRLMRPTSASTTPVRTTIQLGTATLPATLLTVESVYQPLTHFAKVLYVDRFPGTSHQSSPNLPFLRLIKLQFRSPSNLQSASADCSSYLRQVVTPCPVYVHLRAIASQSHVVFVG